MSQTHHGKFTHIDGNGQPRMVDVGGKEPTQRKATARALVRFPSKAWISMMEGDLPKGDLEAPVRLAAIQGAKQTSQIIPLCHLLSLSVVDVEWQVHSEETTIEIQVTVQAYGPTGVEMEAMVGASAGALCLYDLTKALDKGILVESVRLLEKTGGKSGSWRAK
ncbi:MAG: cyclic pyranopterin monophosphate synthase MoaC [Planctomycetes bacterium]|nr:cyclic pyranopterin monophosphate synthase MoaC [Planctomycetota bacterium]